MSLFSNTKDNNFRVQNKSVPVSCSLNINVVSLLLDCMIKTTDFKNYLILVLYKWEYCSVQSL